MSDLIQVPISHGELIDKLTILQIKAERIENENKRSNVKRELETLEQVSAKHIETSKQLEALTEALKQVNQALWDIEDDIRQCEREKQFGDTFVELARSVYKTNDKRAALKAEINSLLGSELVEEKSYAEY